MAWSANALYCCLTNIASAVKFGLWPMARSIYAIIKMDLVSRRNYNDVLGAIQAKEMGPLVRNFEMVFRRPKILLKFFI